MKTKGGSNIVSAIHNLTIVKLHFTSFINEHKASSGARMFSTCNSRIGWIYEQMQCHPFLDQSVRDAIKSEWQSDVFLPDENMRKPAHCAEKKYNPEYYRMNYRSERYSSCRKAYR